MQCNEGIANKDVQCKEIKGGFCKTVGLQYKMSGEKMGRGVKGKGLPCKNGCRAKGIEDLPTPHHPSPAQSKPSTLPSLQSASKKLIVA